MSLKLTIELLPKGAWGNDLSATLTKKEWDEIRKKCYVKANNRCEICGYESDDLDAHEVWEFDISEKTQTLMDIVALCSRCHGVKHMRNSARLGFGLNAKNHFLNVNNCSEQDFEKHYSEATRRFEEQNKVLRWNMKTKYHLGDSVIKHRQIPFIKSSYENVDWENATRIKTAIHKYSTLNSNYDDLLRTYDFKRFSGIVFSKKDNEVEKIALKNYTHMIVVSDDELSNYCESFISSYKTVFEEKYIIPLLSKENMNPSGLANAVKRGEFFLSFRNESNINDYKSWDDTLPPKINSIEVNNYQGKITVVADRVHRIEWFLDGKMIKRKYNLARTFSIEISVENLEGKNLYLKLISKGGETCSNIFVLKKI